METEHNEELKSFVLGVREAGVTEVRIVFLDYNGLARARSVSIQSLEHALTHGVNFSSPTVDFNSQDLFPRSAAFDLASPDFWAKPDPVTYRSIPSSPGRGQMLSYLVDGCGAPWPGCPRTALRRVVERAAELGFHFNVGFEPEGYIFRDSDGELALLAPPEFATLDGLSIEEGFTRDLLQDLAMLGLQVEQWSKEYGPGQIEVNLRHGSALEAADGVTLFKQTFRSVAKQHGMLATFMPKPFPAHAGSGLHVHLSVSPVRDPSKNLFQDDGDPDFGLSDLGRHALAGLLAHGEAVTAMGAATVNSYKRFQPGSWAPTHITYAYASRAAFVRIPERETARRLELRIGDGAGNPHLYLAAILASMLDGIERRLDPGSATPGDVGSLSGEEGAARQLRAVPSTLEHALDYLEKDKVVREALGPLIVDEFLKIKRSEWESFRLSVSEWDRQWYLRRY